MFNQKQSGHLPNTDIQSTLTLLLEGEELGQWKENTCSEKRENVHSESQFNFASLYSILGRGEAKFQCIMHHALPILLRKMHYACRSENLCISCRNHHFVNIVWIEISTQFDCFLFEHNYDCIFTDAVGWSMRDSQFWVDWKCNFQLFFPPLFFFFSMVNSFLNWIARTSIAWQ